MRALLFFLLLTTSIYTEEDSEPIPETSSQTTHEIMLPSGPLVYTANVDSIPVRDEKGKERGRIFFTSYCKEGIENLDTRPITFAFDGGPGGSSAGVHLGGFGPKRLLSLDEGQKILPPYAWIDNPDTLLELTDLVFIDPMGTGYSRTKDEEDADHFYSVPGDLISIGDFICDILTKSGRWKSPKYLAGVSYGTFRACGLAYYLLHHGVFLNGLILDSCALDYQTFEFLPDNELPYSLILPSFAATAWYHGRLDPRISLSEAIDQARHFALDTFAPALLKHGIIPPELYVNISYWTGLPLDFVERHQGLIDDMTYCTNFFSSATQVIGHSDSRSIGQILPPRQNRVNYVDPGIQGLGLFAAITHAYFHEELNCKIDWPRYELFSSEVFSQWKWYDGTIPNMTEHLRCALVINPKLRLFIACGYYDLNTPFAAVEYSLKRLHLPLENSATFRYYEAGHGTFGSPITLRQFKTDMIKFYSEY